MIRIAMAATVSIAAFSLAACGPSGEDDVFAGTPLGKSADSASAPASAPKGETKAADVYISEMTRIADALDTVDDNATAEQAAEVIAASVMRINTRMAAMEEGVSISEAMAFVGSRREQIMEVSNRFSTRLAELQDQHPELTEKIAEALEDLYQVD